MELGLSTVDPADAPGHPKSFAGAVCAEQHCRMVTSLGLVEASSRKSLATTQRALPADAPHRLMSRSPPVAWPGHRGAQLRHWDRRFPRASRPHTQQGLRAPVFEHGIRPCWVHGLSLNPTPDSNIPMKHPKNFRPRALKRKPALRRGTTPAAHKETLFRLGGKELYQSRWAATRHLLAEPPRPKLPPDYGL